MTIVKKISSDLAKERSHDIFKNQAFFEWGLGDDGNLYVRYSMSGHHRNSWVLYETSGIAISMEEMKKVLKEFGHLVVFS